MNSATGISAPSDSELFVNSPNTSVFVSNLLAEIKSDADTQCSPLSTPNHDQDSLRVENTCASSGEASCTASLILTRSSKDKALQAENGYTSDSAHQPLPVREQASKL
eukprot:410919_1